MIDILGGLFIVGALMAAVASVMFMNMWCDAKDDK
jgi:hypothetical protein